MALRFIEYIEVDGEQMSLYIIQEAYEGDVRCFRIEVHDHKRFDFFLCKEVNQEWKVITQDFPEFIIVKLFEPLTTSIERRLVMEKNYLNFN